MSKEDGVIWIIKADRKKSKGVVAGVWEIETVIGTERAKHQENYWKNKYRNDDNVTIIRTQKG